MSRDRTRALAICLFILLLVWMCSCSYDPPQDHPYKPNQPVMLSVDVIPLGIDPGRINMDLLRKEVNADYFNRYGIGVAFSLEENNIPDSLFYDTGLPMLSKLPKLPVDRVRLFVTDGSLLPSGVAGIAYVGRQTTMVRLYSLYGTTVAHELGHLYGLGHMPEGWNVMYYLGNSQYRDNPRRFYDEQIDTIMGRLYEPIEASAIIYN